MLRRALSPFLSKCIAGIWGVILVAALAGCVRHSEPADVLRVQLGAEPVSLDPALAEDGVSLQLLNNTMEGLVGYDGDGHLQNRIAEAYRVVEGGRRYEFTLRANAAWSDGVPVTAQQFVAGITRGLDPKIGSKLAMLFGPLKKVTSPDDRHLVIELKYPAPYFIQALTLSLGFPIRKDILDAHQGHWPVPSPGTGPYFIAEHRMDRKYILRRNEHYWGAPPGVSTVEFWVVSEEETGSNLFEQHKLDVLSSIPAFDLPRYRKKGVVHTSPYAATYYIAFNTRKPPFEDRDWRRAVAGSIRKGELMAALDTGDQPASSWIPPEIEGYVPYSASASDVFSGSVKKVSKLAPVEAPVSATFSSGGRNALILEKIQQDLLKGIGLRISLSHLDWKSYIKSLQTDPSPIYRFGWLAPFGDPVPHLQVFTGKNPNNYTGWSNPRYDRLVSEIERMKPGAERETKIREAQRILVEDEAPVVPIYHYVQNHAVSSRVLGFHVNPFGTISLGEIRLAQP